MQALAAGVSGAEPGMNGVNTGGDGAGAAGVGDAPSGVSPLVGDVLPPPPAVAETRKRTSDAAIVRPVGANFANEAPNRLAAHRW